MYYSGRKQKQKYLWKSHFFGSKAKIYVFFHFPKLITKTLSWATRIIRCTNMRIIQATRGHGWPKASHDHGCRPKADTLGGCLKKWKWCDREWVINSNKHIWWSKKEGYSTYTTLQWCTKKGDVNFLSEAPTFFCNSCSALIFERNL